MQSTLMSDRLPDGIELVSESEIQNPTEGITYTGKIETPDGQSLGTESQAAAEMLEEKQEVLDKLINIGTEFEVDERTITVKSRSIKRMIMIQHKVVKLNSLLTGGGLRTNDPEFLRSPGCRLVREVVSGVEDWDMEDVEEVDLDGIDLKPEEDLELTGDEDLEDDSQQVYNIGGLFETYYGVSIDILFLILNDNLREPEFDRQWILDNMQIGGGDGVGRQILQSYKENCSSVPFLQDMLGLITI